jgi:hypothetical protein
MVFVTRYDEAAKTSQAAMGVQLGKIYPSPE